jgi:hypothetical protein
MEPHATTPRDHATTNRNDTFLLHSTSEPSSSGLAQRHGNSVAPCPTVDERPDGSYAIGTWRMPG